MTPAKLNVFFGFYPYSGSGGVSSEHPSNRKWFADTLLKCKADPRVGEVFTRDYCDTPIPMTRNRSVADAQQLGADVIVMCDSDNHPDLYIGRDPLAKPFWDSSFDFLYERKKKGLVTTIGAPYCGPPPIENVYVFRFAADQSGHPGLDCRVEAYSREDAAGRAGIETVAALPTGLIMYDIAVFDVIGHPYFYYEFDGDGPQCPHCGISAPGPQANKASTEDVTATRDMALFGLEKLGYSPVFVNWDAWAGHWKPKCVGKPTVLSADNVGAKYREAVKSGRRSDEKLITVRPGPVVEAILRRQAADLAFAGDGWANGTPAKA